MRFDRRPGGDVRLLSNFSVSDVLHLRDQASILTHVAAFCGTFESDIVLTQCSTVKDFFVAGGLLLGDEDCTSRSLNSIMSSYMDRVITQVPMSLTRVDAVIRMVHDVLEGAIVRGNWPDADATRLSLDFETHKSTCLGAIGTQPSYACKQTTCDSVSETSHQARPRSCAEKKPKSFDEMFFTSDSWEHEAMKAAGDAESKAATDLADELQRGREEHRRHAIASMTQNCQECGGDIRLGDHITHCDVGWCHSSCAGLDK